MALEDSEVAAIKQMMASQEVLSRSSKAKELSVRRPSVEVNSRIASFFETFNFKDDPVFGDGGIFPDELPSAIEMYLKAAAENLSKIDEFYPSEAMALENILNYLANLAFYEEGEKENHERAIIILKENAEKNESSMQCEENNNAKLELELSEARQNENQLMSELEKMKAEVYEFEKQKYEENQELLNLQRNNQELASEVQELKECQKEVTTKNNQMMSQLVEARAALEQSEELYYNSEDELSKVYDERNRLIINNEGMDTDFRQLSCEYQAYKKKATAELSECKAESEVLLQNNKENNLKILREEDTIDYLSLELTQYKGKVQSLQERLKEAERLESQAQSKVLELTSRNKQQKEETYGNINLKIGNALSNSETQLKSNNNSLLSWIDAELNVGDPTSKKELATKINTQLHNMSVESISETFTAEQPPSENNIDDEEGENSQLHSDNGSSEELPDISISNYEELSDLETNSTASAGDASAKMTSANAGNNMHNSSEKVLTNNSLETSETSTELEALAQNQRHGQPKHNYKKLSNENKELKLRVEQLLLYIKQLKAEGTGKQRAKVLDTCREVGKETDSGVTQGKNVWLEKDNTATGSQQPLEVSATTHSQVRISHMRQNDKEASLLIEQEEERGPEVEEYTASKQEQNVGYQNHKLDEVEFVNYLKDEFAISREPKTTELSAVVRNNEEASRRSGIAIDANSNFKDQYGVNTKLPTKQTEVVELNQEQNNEEQATVTFEENYEKRVEKSKKEGNIIENSFLPLPSVSPLHIGDPAVEGVRVRQEILKEHENDKAGEEIKELQKLEELKDFSEAYLEGITRADNYKVLSESSKAVNGYNKGTGNPLKYALVFRKYKENVKEKELVAALDSYNQVSNVFIIKENLNICSKEAEFYDAGPGCESREVVRDAPSTEKERNSISSLQDIDIKSTNESENAEEESRCVFRQELGGDDLEGRYREEFGSERADSIINEWNSLPDKTLTFSQEPFNERTTNRLRLISAEQIYLLEEEEAYECKDFEFQEVKINRETYKSMFRVINNLYSLKVSKDIRPLAKESICEFINEKIIPIENINSSNVAMVYGKEEFNIEMFEIKTEYSYFLSFIKYDSISRENINYLVCQDIRVKSLEWTTNCCAELLTHLCEVLRNNYFDLLSQENIEIDAVSVIWQYYQNKYGIPYISKSIILHVLINVLHHKEEATVIEIVYLIITQEFSNEQLILLSQMEKRVEHLSDSDFQQYIVSKFKELPIALEELRPPRDIYERMLIIIHLFSLERFQFSANLVNLYIKIKDCNNAEKEAILKQLTLNYELNDGDSNTLSFVEFAEALQFQPQGLDSYYEMFEFILVQKDRFVKILDASQLDQQQKEFLHGKLDNLQELLCKKQCARAYDELVETITEYQEYLITKIESAYE